MRWLCWLLVAGLLGSTTGCSCGTGATSLSDMKRRAIVRPDDDEDEFTPAAAPAPTPVDVESEATVAPPLQPAVVAPPAVAKPAPVISPPAATPVVEETPKEETEPGPEPTAVATNSLPNAEIPDVAPTRNVAPPEPSPPAITSPEPEPPAVKSPPDPEPPHDERLPIPDAPAQQAGKRILAELYRADYEMAKTPEQKRALAKALLAKAKQMDGDATGQYLVLKLVLDLAKSAGEVELTLAAIDMLTTTFAIDREAETLEALESVAKLLRSQADAQRFLSECERLTKHAVDRDDFAQALRTLDLAEIVAKRGKLNAQLERVEQARKLVTETRAAFANVPAARSALETSPTSPAANLEVGKYLCFYKRQWEQGLPHLAAGSDVKLKVLAQIDHSIPTNPAQQADLAGQWYDLAQDGQKPWVEQSLLLRAAHWYQLSFDSLPNGLVKSRVQKRLSDIATATGDSSLKAFVAGTRNVLPEE